MVGRNFCLLGDSAPVPYTSALKLFREEFEYHITHKTCLVGPRAGKQLAGVH
jgi:NADH-quinone oxidoreductase subunit F